MHPDVYDELTRWQDKPAFKEAKKLRNDEIEHGWHQGKCQLTESLTFGSSFGQTVASTITYYSNQTMFSIGSKLQTGSNIFLRQLWEVI